MGTAFAIPLDDHTLSRARRGDLAALETIYRTFETPVFNLAHRLLRHPHDAEEVTQETFLEVLRSLGRYRGDGPFWAWVRRVAASKALMRMRAARSRPQKSLEEEPAQGEAVAVMRPHEQSVLARVDLEAALDALSDTARAVIWLHDVEGYTHEEIGALLGRTASFSKSQLARGHERLRTILGENGEGPCTRVSTRS